MRVVSIIVAVIIANSAVVRAKQHTSRCVVQNGLVTKIRSDPSVFRVRCARGFHLASGREVDVLSQAECRKESKRRRPRCRPNKNRIRHVQSDDAHAGLPYNTTSGDYYGDNNDIVLLPDEEEQFGKEAEDYDSDDSYVYTDYPTESDNYYGQYYDYDYEASGDYYDDDEEDPVDIFYEEDHDYDLPTEEDNETEPEVGTISAQKETETSTSLSKDSYDTEDVTETDPVQEATEKPNAEDYEYESEEYESGKSVAVETTSRKVSEEEEALYRSYEILSEFYKLHFVDLRVLDTTCNPEEVPPPPIANGYVKEYLTSENALLPGQKYHEVVYACDPGYKLSDISLGHMFCQQKGWMGVQPYCEEDPNADVSVQSTKEPEACETNNGCEHECKLLDGVPTCFCREGYEKYDVTMCVDVDECLENNGGCSHECINKPGTYTCECPDGYSSDGRNCVDINECLSNNSHGPCQDTCINLDGSYECSCENLPGSTLHPDGHTCETVDMCKVNNGGCSHECYTTYGQSFCMCPSGYKLAEDWKTCIDVDECATMASVRESCGKEQRCENTMGSFRCVSKGGTVAPEEVQPEKESTESSEQYEDVEDMYSVESRQNCDEGYDFDVDANICVDHDECTSGNPCGFGTCINREPGYECSCSNGFSFDGSSCVDIDECFEDSGRCGSGGSCINTEGGFECQCNQGYAHENGICVDVDECIEKCQEHGQCINEPGTFRCDCEKGFRYDSESGVCLDIDECVLDPENACGGRAECVNTEGSYECICHGRHRN